MTRMDLQLLDASVGAIDAAQWDDLLERQPRPTPFMRHAYLDALSASGSATAATGWQPLVLVGRRGSELVAAAPLYAKSHSFGEYVFDWAWAEAYERHGLDYYPKLVCAVPMTPVPGTRLLAADPAARRELARALAQLPERTGCSSLHVLFADDDDLAALDGQDGWLVREGTQFHWTRPTDAPCPDFDAFLASMTRHKRKNIAQEQRRVREAGVTFEVREGAAIDAPTWDLFYRCHVQTYREHGRARPYLTRAFFAELATRAPQMWVAFVARRDGRDIACSLVAIDRERRSAWGRFWGSLEPVPFLHFDACYYQPLAWCIANGFERFEGGAQGEHKIARGLLPTRTASAHRIVDSRFADAVGDFLAREGPQVAAWRTELEGHTPFASRPGIAGDDAPSEPAPQPRDGSGRNR